MPSAVARPGAAPAPAHRWQWCRTPSWVGAGLAGIVLLVVLASGADAASPPRDRLPPTKPIIDGERQTFDQQPVFKFNATDRRTPRSRLRFRCALDGTALRPCARTHLPSAPLAFGEHVMRAQALDLAGNASHTAIFSFSVIAAWDAEADFERAPRPANPGHDIYGNTAWFYLYSGTPAHEPSDYHLLPNFVALNPTWEVWRRHYPDEAGPSIGIGDDWIVMHPGHPNLGQNAVLGWRSPMAASVALSAAIATSAQSTCDVGANGVLWSIDQGSRTLLSGALGPGASENLELETTVALGESLYIVVNDAGDSNCDTARVQLAIHTR